MTDAINTNGKRQMVYLETYGCQTKDLTQQATKLAVTYGDSPFAVPCEKT